MRGFKHLERHPRPVDGCFGCKVMNVGFGSVPGGTTAAAVRKGYSRQFDKDLHVYREARRAGERPNASTEKAVRRNRMNQERLEKLEKKGVVHVE